MNNYSRPATMDDVRYVAEHMREEDIEEAGAFMLSPLESLTVGLQTSDVAYTLLTPEGVPCAILGIAPSSLFKNWGAIWMLGTEDIARFPMTFLRHSKDAIPHLFEQTGYDAFFNYTYVANTLHHKWLRWCGFKFIRKVELPPLHKEFYEFITIKG